MESKKVQKILEDLLTQIGVKADIAVEENKDGNFTASCDSGEDNALLIGKHGNTLASLELIATLIVTNKLKEFRRVTIEIGNYKAEREQYLRELADKLREEVITSGYEKQVRGLKAWERRFLHMYLQDDDKVATESIGEERERTLIIKRK